MTFNDLGRFLRDTKQTYREYLNGPIWKNRREIYWIAHGNDAKCFVCHRTGKLDLHHITYENVGCEPDRDLVFLCRPHHTLCHEAVKRGWTSLRFAHLAAFYIQVMASIDEMRQTIPILSNQFELDAIYRRAEHRSERYLAAGAFEMLGGKFPPGRPSPDFFK